MTAIDETIKMFIVEGLYTDGEHHKQWYLEQLLIKLGFNKEEIIKKIENDGYDAWEEGVPP